MTPTSKFHSVMLIDDNEIDNLINQKMIESSSISQHILIHTGARSAIEFLRNIEKLSSTVPEAKKLIPEIILLDIDMPLMDGFQFLEEFEKFSEFIKSSTKIVMLTSSLNPSDLNRAKKSKYVTKYLNKPLSFDNLLGLAA
jgi:CheY-like chemotaxis protein